MPGSWLPQICNCIFHNHNLEIQVASVVIVGYHIYFWLLDQSIATSHSPPEDSFIFISHSNISITRLGSFLLPSFLPPFHLSLAVFAIPLLGLIFLCSLSCLDKFAELNTPLLARLLPGFGRLGRWSPLDHVDGKSLVC